jgi:hypothetical protein
MPLKKGTSQKVSFEWVVSPKVIAKGLDDYG